MATDHWPREKKWKHVYTRSNKLHRARQLGFIYPRESDASLMERESVTILFVCSKNRWRSPTAEKIYANKPLVIARSCGTNRNANRKIVAADLKWADIVFVMENKHRQRLLTEFPSEMRFKEVHVLGILDKYKFMAPELIAEIEAVVEPILTQA